MALQGPIAIYSTYFECIHIIAESYLFTLFFHSLLGTVLNSISDL